MHTSDGALTSLYCIADEYHDTRDKVTLATEQAMWTWALTPSIPLCPHSTPDVHHLLNGLACGLLRYIRSIRLKPRVTNASSSYIEALRVDRVARKPIFTATA